MRRNWPFFKDSDWLILVFVHSAKPTAELENLAMSPSLSSPGLSYDTKFVQVGWELRSSLVGDTILGVQSEPACIYIYILKRNIVCVTPLAKHECCVCHRTIFNSHTTNEWSNVVLPIVAPGYCIQ